MPESLPIPLALTAPILGRIEHAAANPLRLPFTWPADVPMPAAMTIRAELHTSQSVPPGTVPLAAVVLPVTAGTAQPWILEFSSAQMNQPMSGKTERTFYLSITGIVAPGTLYSLWAAIVVLHWHPCSQTTPPPPAVPLYQPMLQSGVNLKTINGQSLLGSGNLDIEGTGGAPAVAAVLYTEQTLTSPQQTQARLNIGAAGLDGAGRLLASQLPDLAVSEFLGSVASQAAMLALNGQRGDWCHRSDSGTNWIVIAEPTSLLTSWRQLSYPASPVTSVAGRTGVITLGIPDIAGLGAALDAKADESHVHGTASGTEDGFMPAASFQKLAALPDAPALASQFAAKADLAGGKLRTDQLPDLAIVQFLGEVASQTAMLALTGQQGDWCTRTDLGTVWQITGPNPAILANWRQLSYPASPVVSVAGRTGAVTLSLSDLTDTTAVGRALAAAADAAAQRSLLGLGGLAVKSTVATADLADASVTAAKLAPGAVTSSTLGDFASAVRAQIAAMLQQGSNVTLTQSGSGAALQITIAATAGGGSPGGTDGAVQYRVNSTTFGGVTGLTLSSGTLQRAAFADPGLGATPAADTLLLENPTPASGAGVPQASPRTTRKGSVWRPTGGATALEISDYVGVLENGDNPYLRWCVDGRIGGGAWGNIFQAQRYLGLNQIRIPGTGAGWAPQLTLGVSVGFFTTDQSQNLFLAFAGSTMFSWNGGGEFSIVDCTIRRVGAGNLCQGAADGAAPVSQRSSVQNVATGTLNTAGADRHFDASRGTGTGTGGAHVFNVATAAGGSGSAQNALVEAMRIRQDRAVFLANVSATPATPTGGGVYFVQDGALKYIGSSGTITTLAPA